MEPVFKQVFGSAWETLPPALKKHYNVRPYSRDSTTVKGVLNVQCKKSMRLLTPFYRLLGLVPAVNETQVPVTVRFESTENSTRFHFNRTFELKSRPYQFKSAMLSTTGNEVLEVMRFGLCWLSNFRVSDGQIDMEHKGYGLMLGNKLIPLPISALIGRGYGMERAVDDNSFDMLVTITHPLFGNIYRYEGRFEVTNIAVEDAK